jgi:hypothetical protein
MGAGGIWEGSHRREKLLAVRSTHRVFEAGGFRFLKMAGVRAERVLDGRTSLERRKAGRLVPWLSLTSDVAQSWIFMGGKIHIFNFWFCKSYY